jgi:hypothetical protein
MPKLATSSLPSIATDVLVVGSGAAAIAARRRAGITGLFLEPQDRDSKTRNPS